MWQHSDGLVPIVVNVAVIVMMGGIVVVRNFANRDARCLGGDGYVADEEIDETDVSDELGKQWVVRVDHVAAFVVAAAAFAGAVVVKTMGR